MTNHAINADYSQRVVVDTELLSFAPSPAPGVWRKRLELSGGVEDGRVTSVVRYDPGASYPLHDHPEGEEILVLQGDFCDERGSFREGSYQLNPEGFRHAPYTRNGCTLLVKLRQYGGEGREVVLLDTHTGRWVDRGIPGVRSQELYRSDRYSDAIRLTEFDAGTKAPEIHLPLGEEVFVLRGSFEDEYDSYGSGTWLRMPKGFSHTPSSAEGCLLYVKSGGFPA